MRTFLKDMLIFPFDKHPETNKFSAFLTTMFKEYPAFLWTKPSFKKFLIFPLLVLYAIFRNKKK